MRLYNRSDFQPPILYALLKLQNLWMYLKVLVPPKNLLNRAMNGDHFGVCFVKIGRVVLELCTRKISFNENAIQNIWG